MMKFYKSLGPSERISFLTDLFYVARYDPGYYSSIWIPFLLLFLFFSNTLFIGSLLFLFIWYLLYFLLLQRFIYKWKKKHLYNSKT